MHTARFNAVALLAVSLLLVGCGSDRVAVSPTTATPIPPSASTPSPSPRSLAFNLNALKGYTAHGTVRVDINSDGYTMTVIVKGLAPKSTHLLNMHSGSCADPNTFTLVGTVGSATADAKGILSSVTTWPGAYALSADGQILTVHTADPDTFRAHIACADMTV
jgi:hypothetical protein